MSEEELLLKRIKVIGDGEFTLLGTPDELIKEFHSYAQEKCREALATLFSEYGTITNPNYTYMINDRDLKRRIAQLNKSKGE